MTEVTLVKRFYVLVLIVLMAVFAAACTREKPADTPVPTIAAQRTVVTPPLAGTAVAADVTATITPTLVLTPTTPVAPAVTVTPTQVVVAPPTPAVTTPPTTSPGTYTVQWGDWLSKIANQFGVTTQQLVAANPGINPNFISPGQVLNIPSSTSPGLTPVPPTIPPTGHPSTYTVQRGDWIYALARRFGVTVAALLAANPGIHPNLLYPGQVLSIPSGTTPQPDPPPPSGNTYTVQRGDTLYSIAVRFKTTIMALQIANKLANPNFISPGQVLTIPQ
ncbi:MAG: LysM peptidoglycan-binding domain-containing protein [Chloroflexi bacterium]|nr:LysM peptidoglycan-binding domain-containing protein [Chloroflexota bacterium]